MVIVENTRHATFHRPKSTFSCKIPKESIRDNNAKT